MSAQPIDPRALKAAAQIYTASFAISPRAAEDSSEVAEFARIIQSHFEESVNGKLLEAARVLCKQMDVVHNDSRYLAVYQLAQIHGIQYDGPFYDDELSALNSAIALAQSQPPSMDKFDPACGDCDPCIGGRPDQCALFPTKTNMADELAEALRKSVDNCFRCDGEGIVRRLENEVCPQCGKHRELLARFDAQKGQ